MKSTLIKWTSLGIALFLTVFLAGCYTQLATYSTTEESYTASKSDQGSSSYSYAPEENPSQQQPAESDTEYYPEEQEQARQDYDNGTTNIYNFYSPTYPYGAPYWPYGWWGDVWYDYPPYDGFYFSVSFGAPYYYDPFLWDWRYRWYDDFWYSPYRYRYSMWYREWRYGYDPYNWWWYDSYTYERMKMKRRPFGRREGLDRRGPLEGPVAIGSGMGGSGTATGLRKAARAPLRNRPGLTDNPARIPKRRIQTDRTDDVIRVSKGVRSEEIAPSRIRKAKRAPRMEGLLVRHPKRVRKIRREEEASTRNRAIRSNERLRKVRTYRTRQTRNAEPRLYKTRERRPHYRPEPKIHTHRTRSTPRRSTRIRYIPPRRESHPIIRHRSAPSRSYSPPPKISAPAARAPRSSSSSSGSHSSPSRRERK